MNKLSRLLLVFLTVILIVSMFTACQPSKKILSIEVDETTIADAFDVATFDVSQIYLIITYEDEETERISLSSTMIKAEDKVKLRVPGTHTITVTYKQRTTTFTLTLKEGIAGKYKVIFLNEDGTQIGETQYVEEGGSAVSPPYPTKPEHVFDGWIDQHGMYSFLDNITENKTFTATFKPDFCIVKFVMPDGSLIHEAKIKKGASAESVAPQFPNVPGQTAVGWDKSLDNITEDVTVFAVYMQDNIKVTFVYGADGRQSKTVNYAAYTEITPTVSPIVDHAEFLGWYTDDKFEGQAVTFPYLLRNEITFYAKYVSRTKGSDGLEFSETGSNSYTISGYNGNDDVIVIPEKYNNLDVVGIESRAFLNCNNSRFYVTDSNEYFSITDGVLFDAAKEKIIAYPAGKQDNQYAVPVSVKSIEPYAFANAQNLVLVTFSGSNLMTIDNYAFYNCANLREINIPRSVEKIGEGAFYMERGSRMNRLTFERNSQLQQIGNEAFRGLNNIETITLPSALEEIESSVFYGCQSLKEIQLENNSSESFIVVDGVLYDNDMEVLIAFPADNAIISSAAFTVPDEVVTIKAGAFIDSSIVGIVLPQTITTIEGYAFNSPKLQYIQFTADRQPDNLSDIMFGDYPPAFCIVPAGSQSQFPSFANMQFIEDAPEQVYYFNVETGYLYTRDNENKLTLLGARSPGVSLQIPAQINDYQVVAIGKYAFYNNNAITDIVIGEGIEIIEEEAFRKLSALTAVTLPSSLISIGKNAFADCPALQTVNYDAEITLQNIGDQAFVETPWYEQSSVEYLTIGNILIKYNGQGSVAELPDNIEIIADNAFIDKTNLKSVTLNSGLKIIGSYAFYGCSALFYVIIPESVEYIGEQAFSYCPNLYRIVMKSQLPPEIASTGVFTTSASYSYADKRYDFSIMVPYNASGLYLDAYRAHDDWAEYAQYITHLNERTIAFSSPGSETLSLITNAVYEPQDPIARPGFVFAGWYTQESEAYQKTHDPIVFPMEIEENQPFYARWFHEEEGVDGLEYQLINDGTEYAISAYRGELKYVVIPSKYKDKPVTKILKNAFSEAVNPINAQVYNIIIPHTIREIDKGAFEQTLWYSQYRGDYVYLNDILIEYRGAKEEVVVPEHIKYITAGAFKDNSAVKSIIFPQDIEILPAELMYNCSALTDIVLPANLKKIESKAFMDCFSLRTIDFPSTIEEIASDAFENTAWLKNYVDDVVVVHNILYKYKGDQPSLHLPNIVTKIEKDAFKDNIFINYLYIPSTVNTIAQSAFEGCINLIEVIFSQNTQIRYIGDRAFYGCIMLKNFSLGDNMLTSIGEYAFAYCSGLANVEFSSTVEHIGKRAYFESGISFARFNDNSVLLSVLEDTFRNCINLKTVVFGNNCRIENISVSAFENCGNLMSVIIPENNRKLTKIEDNAFKDCVSLVNVSLPSSLMEIGDDAFLNAPYVESNNDLIMTVGSVLLRYIGDDTVVTISKDVAAISKGAFKDNHYITKVVFEEGSRLFAIGDEAFAGCVNLADINFPNTLEHIGRNALEGTKWLNDYLDDYVIINDILVKYKGSSYQAIVPPNVRTIGVEAFYGNTKLRNIEIGPNVNAILARAFDGMSEENSTITMLKAQPPILDQDNDIVSVIYVENNAVFNNYREDPSWSRFVTDSSESIIVKYRIRFDLVYAQAYLETTEIEVNALFVEPVPQMAGYTFIGWYEYYNESDDEYSGLIKLPYFPDSDITLYAKWLDDYTGTAAGDFRIVSHQPDGDFESGPYIIEYTGIDRYCMIPLMQWDEYIAGITKMREPFIDPSTGEQMVDEYGNPVFIEGSAFAGNEVLEEVVFVHGSQVKYIMDGAFENCTSLRRIVLPSTLEYIGPNAFKNCVALEEVIFTGGGFNSLVIDENAFYGCVSLKTITFESNVSFIGDNAFGGCVSLTSIYMNGEFPPEGNAPFEINEGMKIYVNRSINDVVVMNYKVRWPLYEQYIVPKPQ